MEILTNTNFELIAVPLLIFLARIIDVSLGTVRIIFVSKGYKYIAPIIGFFEIFIWIIAITRIMQNINSWGYYVAYAAGFATGNFVGIWIEEKLAIGFELLRIITKSNPAELIRVLREKGYGTTYVNAQGKEGEVGVIYVIVKRKKMAKVVDIIHKLNPNAFYTIEDIKFVSKKIDYLPSTRSNFQRVPTWKRK